MKFVHPQLVHHDRGMSSKKMTVAHPEVSVCWLAGILPRSAASFHVDRVVQECEPVLLDWTIFLVSPEIEAGLLDGGLGISTAWSVSRYRFDAEISAACSTVATSSIFLRSNRHLGL